MAMFYCENCDNHVDDDFHPMEPHPYRKRLPSYKYVWVCPSCAEELEYELEEAIREDLNDEY